MSLADLLAFAWGALTGHRLRTALSLLGVAIGVAAVVLLTALGEGARAYVVDQFQNLGTDLLVVIPGRTETTGAVPGPGGIPNDLTLDDAQALERRLRAVRRVAPISMGTEEVAFGPRRRQLAVIGTTPEYREVRGLELERGSFLPAVELERGSPQVVLGHDAAEELFPAGVPPLGQVVRVGEWRMRVIGILAPQGVKLGVNFDELALVPVATGMAMFDRSSLFRILVQARPGADLDELADEISALITERHDEEDVTVITQDAVLSTFDRILQTLTLALAAIAAISLSVAGIGIMNVMLVSVSERTREVGLLKALGVGRGQILAAFLAEAALLSTAGGLVGLAVGWLLVRLMVRLYPALPASPPLWAVAAALAVSVVVGVVFGLVPARRATRLEAVESLAGR